MTKDLKIVVSVAALLLILGAAGVFTYNFSKKQKNTSQNNTRSTSTAPSQNGTLVDAPAGEVISGFPQTLAPVGGTLVSSFSRNYVQATQYSANYTSDRSIASEYESYVGYLNTNKYTIVNKEISSTAAYLYGTNDSGTVSITITPKQGTKLISIAIGYLKTK